LVLRPPKGTSLRGTASFDVFCVKIRAGVLAVDDLKNPPKKRTNSRVNNLTREIAHAKRNPLSDLDEIVQDGSYPRRNHVGKFWWRSVKGFSCGGGSNFGLSHWHWSSSLQHSRTTVRVCDFVILLVFSGKVRDNTIKVWWKIFDRFVNKSLPNG